MRLEIRKNITTFYFVISILLLFIVFLLGDSGSVLPNQTTSTTILGAIWNKFHGNWQRCSDTSYLVRMHHMWTDNVYLPVLMPFICSLPCVLRYIEERESGNKKFILVRSSLKRYYLSKIVGNAVCAVLIVLAAVALYYTVLVLFFEDISTTEEEYAFVYYVFSGELLENTAKASKLLVYGRLIKGVVYFCLYAVMSSAFAFWIAVKVKDKYTTFGCTVFLTYLQSRIVEELVRKYISDGIESAGTMSDILNPVFLYYAGRSGFYEDKEVFAVVLALLIIVFHYIIFYRTISRQFDLCER